MQLIGGTALENVTPYDFAGSFCIAYSFYGDVIEVTHSDGNPLISGIEEESIYFERSYG
jgi:hypothetical protein